jgi:hypothetical protein
MSQDAATFRPIPTCDIPMPIVEGTGETRVGESVLPRILLQAAGTGHAVRNVNLLTGLFLLAAIMELGLFLRLPTPAPEIVYGDFPRLTLLGGHR